MWEPYNAVRRSISRYMGSAMVIIDDGDQMRIKSTHRMYEQWVFLQIASALKRAGLRCEGVAEVVRRQTRFRYTLDVDRGTRITFRDRTDRLISIRYEPWIFSETTAKQRRDTVYQGRHEDAAWSPDVSHRAVHAGDARGGRTATRACDCRGCQVILRRLRSITGTRQRNTCRSAAHVTVNRRSGSCGSPILAKGTSPFSSETHQ